MQEPLKKNKHALIGKIFDAKRQAVETVRGLAEKSVEVLGVVYSFTAIILVILFQNFAYYSGFDNWFVFCFQKPHLFFEQHFCSFYKFLVYKLQ